MQRCTSVSNSLRSVGVLFSSKAVGARRSVQLSTRMLEDFEKQRVAFDPPADLPAPSSEPLTPAVAKFSKLPNGVRVATLSSKTPLASLAVFVDAGSRHDTTDVAGASYLIGRLGYASTQNRTSLRLVREFDIIGAEYKPVADRDTISYRASVPTNGIPYAAELLADVVVPNLAEWEVRDNQASIADVAEHEATCTATLVERLHEEAFRNAGLGQPLFTPSYNADNLTYDVLQRIVKARYTPDRIAVVGTGGVDHDKLVKLAEQHLSKLSGSSQAPKTTSQYVGGADVRIPGAGPTELGLAFQGASSSAKEANALNVLKYILGGSSASRSSYSVNQSVTQGPGSGITGRLAQGAAKNGFVQDVSAFNFAYADNGLFGVLATAERGNVSALVEALTRDLAVVARNVSAEEVARAKAQAKAEILFNKSGLLEFVGEQALFRGNVQTPAEAAKAIDAVTVDEVVSVAKRVFSSKPTVVVRGDVSGAPTLEQIQKLLSK